MSKPETKIIKVPATFYRHRRHHRRIDALLLV